MFFTATKILSFVLAPPNVLVFAVLVSIGGLWTRFRRTFRLLATLAAGTLALCALTPLPSVLLRPLENRFPRPVLSEAPTGAIVLGGAMDEALTDARKALALNEAAERLTEGAALARRFPTMRLVFSGGSGRLKPAAITEADVARRLWTDMGVPVERMTFEDRSRDTWENAVFTKDLLTLQPGETWLLVTSAAHMPRAVGIFRHIGFAVVPYPVDYRTSGTSADFSGLRNAADGFSMVAVASHEWIGLLAYYLASKTDALFPAP